MENQGQAMDERQEEVGKEKQPYVAPALKNLGTVQELTQGLFAAVAPDNGTWSW